MRGGNDDPTADQFGQKQINRLERILSVDPRILFLKKIYVYG